MCELLDVLINSMGRILSQCICVSNHHIVYFKYLTLSFVNYTSIKLKKKFKLDDKKGGGGVWRHHY